MGHLKKVVSSLLIICFIITDLSPALAETVDTTIIQSAKSANITVDPKIFTDINPDKFTMRPDQLSQEEAEEAKNFLQKPTQTTLEIMFLLKNLYYTVQMEVEKSGEAEVAKVLAKRKDSHSIDFEVENVGKAEPLVINTERGPLFFTKVRHNELKMSILFIDKNQIDLQLLEETERLEKLGLTDWDKTLEGLSPQEIKKELAHRKFILKHMRTLYARMLMSEWNPELRYTPLSEVVEKSNDTSSVESAPEEVQKQVKEVLEAPISELKHKPWFKRVASKSYDTWVDLAKQEQSKAKTNLGNETLMVVLYDGKTGELLNTNTEVKPPKMDLSSWQAFKQFKYWKMYWKAIWEPPSYGEPVWKNSKGLGKMRVLLTGDYLMGLSFGMALGSLSFLVSSALPGSLPSGLDAYDVARVSFGWSLFFGVFGKTWANFVYRGNEFVRFVKNWSTGLGQSYHFNIISNESLIPKGIHDVQALKIHADIVVNQSIKTVTKTSLQEIPRTRAKTGEAEGTLKVPYYRAVLPWKHNMKFLELEATETTIDPLKLVKWLRNQVTIENGNIPFEEKSIIRINKDFRIKLPWLIREEYETYIPRKNFENQTPQFVTTPVGLLSRFGFTVWGVPLGHIMYAILGPIGEVRQIRYKMQYADQLSRSKGESHALTKRYRHIVKTEIENWNSLKILNIPGSQFIGYYVKVVPVSIWETSKELANWFAKQAAYRTYMIYEGIVNERNAMKAEQAKIQETQNRFKELMTVQTEGNKPHPLQIQRGVEKYQANTCARLFQ